MKKLLQLIYAALAFVSLMSCKSDYHKKTQTYLSDSNINVIKEDSTTLPSEPKIQMLTADDIQLEESLLYDKYTLKDHYQYKETERSFKWNRIKEIIAFIENMQQDSPQWLVLKNYRNLNGEAPLVKKYAYNSYRRVADSLGVERYQSVPLYLPEDTLRPVIYGRDGSLIYYRGEQGKFYRAESPADHQTWYVPQKYAELLPDSTLFHHLVFVDRKDQHITTLEHAERGKWLIRSKNPATTGRKKPPYAQETPLGFFLIQQRKRKMVFLKDGSQKTGGYAPYASRFTNGAYIHGVPVNEPRKTPIEYGWSLGTTPRSHMCVRNATSHAKFVYEWAPLKQSLVIIIE